MNNRIWTKVFLSLGSNMGQPEANLAKAIELLKDEFTRIINISQIYKTGAWGMIEQQDFLNQVILIETRLAPRELLNYILALEAKMGRERKLRYGPRVIDIDIIFYDDIIINESGLNIPHPLMHERNFVLIPMKEIAPDFIHPGFGKTIEELYTETRDELPVSIFEPINNFKKKNDTEGNGI